MSLWKTTARKSRYLFSVHIWKKERVWKMIDMFQIFDNFRSGKLNNIFADERTVGFLMLVHFMFSNNFSGRICRKTYSIGSKESSNMQETLGWFIPGVINIVFKKECDCNVTKHNNLATVELWLFGQDSDHNAPQREDTCTVHRLSAVPLDPLWSAMPPSLSVKTCIHMID